MQPCEQLDSFWLDRMSDVDVHRLVCMRPEDLRLLVDDLHESIDRSQSGIGVSSPLLEGALTETL